MKTKLILLSLAFWAFSGAPCVFASDLSMVAAYICEAEEMNESLVKECLSQYPNSSGRITAAWELWRKRNQEDAIKLRQQCKEESNRQDLSLQQREQIQERLTQIRADILGSYPEMVMTQGESFCTGFLESGENDLSHLLNRDAVKKPIERPIIDKRLIGTWKGMAPDGSPVGYVFSDNGRVIWTLPAQQPIHASYEARVRNDLVEVDIFDFDLQQLTGFRFLGIAKVEADRMKFYGTPTKQGRGPDGAPALRPSTFGKDAITFLRIQ